jgi:hypothetical protein
MPKFIDTKTNEAIAFSYTIDSQGDVNLKLNGTIVAYFSATSGQLRRVDINFTDQKRLLGGIEFDERGRIKTNL